VSQRTRQEGWYEDYDVRGKKTEEYFYKLTCITKIIYFDSIGNILQNVDLPGGNGTIDQKHLNGKLWFHREYAFNYPQGKSFVYYNGKIESENPFVNDERDGLTTDYYENGKVAKTLNIIDGVTQGESPVYDELGEIIYVRKYENDILAGYTYNDAKGQLLPFKKIDVGEAKISCFFKNGKKSLDAIYVNGRLNGARTTYCSNGNVAKVQTYLNDLLHGTSKTYYSNGILKTIENHYYSESQGDFKYYYENGKLRKECSFVNDLQHGLTKDYNEAGVLIKTLYYYNGFPISSK
jgi:antitoxin component YwqK of YwqJK toxin-antitoxin module